MQKLFTVEILLVVFFLYVKNGQSLKCFICRSDTDKNCGSSVSLNFSHECPPVEGHRVYCRKISQMLKFKNEKNPTLIRECAYEKDKSACYRFGWISLAKQITCECNNKDNCNHGMTSIPSIITITLTCTLLWVYNFLKRDHT